MLPPPLPPPPPPPPMAMVTMRKLPKFMAKLEMVVVGIATTQKRVKKNF